VRLEELLSSAARTLASGVPLASLASAGVLATLPAPVAEKLDADLRAGVPLSQSLAELQAIGAGESALLRAGELHGGLPEALRAVYARLAHRRKVRAGLLLAAAYPTLLAMGAAVVLPLPLAFREGVGAYLAHAAPPVLALLLAAAAVLLLAPRLPPSSPLRRCPRWIARRIPLGRAAALHGAVASFADVLGACLNAGVPLREAAAAAARAAPHPAFEAAPQRLVEALDGGATLAQALGALRSLPPAFVAQVGTAEVSGTLGSVLPALEEEHERRSRSLWIALAAVVGGSVLVAVLAAIAVQIVSSWAAAFKLQAQEIDRLTR
jgi:type II secretory pathway component PulF